MRSTIITLLCLFFLSGHPLAQKPDTVSLAVLELTAQGVKESEAAIVTEQLRAELMKSPHFRLVERNQMKDILMEQDFQKSECTENSCAIQVGHLLGVKNIVVGSVGVAGSYTVLSVRMLDVSTGMVIVNESIRTKGGIDKVLETGIAAAADKLDKGLFPVVAQAPAPKKEKRKVRKALLIGGGAAVVVGGGIAAAIYFLDRDKPTKSQEPNTEIHIPQ
jgi:TolB-like protein